jgi:D-alanyl-D-alanine carboxypeptidase
VRAIAAAFFATAFAGAAFASPPPLIDRLEATAAHAFAADGPGGVVLVAQYDRLILRRAYGLADVERRIPMRPENVFKIASITKQFTAVAILQLVVQGKVALDDDVRKHIPEFNTQGRRLTIEQVLTHTSGLANFVDRDDFDALSRRPHDVATLLRYTDTMPFLFEPGAGFKYSDSGYILLGAIVERVSGLRYGDYVERRTFRPLGMNHSFYADDGRDIPLLVRGYDVQDGEATDPPPISMSVAYSAGALASSADDLLVWHRALRAGKVLPADLMTRAWQGRPLPSGIHSGYGFGWKMCTLAGRRTIEHGGFINGYTVSAIQIPDGSLDVIVLVNNGSDKPDAGALARQLARVVLIGQPKPPFIALTTQQRAALTGIYRAANGRERLVVERDGVLHVGRNEQSLAAVMALSPTTLTTADGDEGLVYTFELDAQGRAHRVRTHLRCEPVDMAARVSR